MLNLPQKVTMSNNRFVKYTYSDSCANGKLEERNDYYPFGGLMGKGLNGDFQSYKYNGKELERQIGLDIYDYGARRYDAATCRFTTMDPLAEKYYSTSPYAYCVNNPMRFVDTDGKKVKLTSDVDLALNAIKSTLPQNLREFITLKDNFIDVDIMKKGISVIADNPSENYKALYEIVSDKRTVEFSITEKINAVNSSGKPSKDLINFGQTEFFPEDAFGNKAEWITQGSTGISLAPKNHKRTEWDLLQRSKHSIDQMKFSPNKNYQVQINKSMFSQKETLKNGALATTHELYGHILFMFRGWDSCHGVNRQTDNIKLENWLINRANETDKNFSY